MLKKIQHILTYHDSEPMEIMLGITWLIVFPVIWSLDQGLNLWFVIPSMIIGLATLKSVCDYNIRIRKSIAYASFIFSCVISLLSIINFSFIYNPTQSIWLLTSIAAFYNLRNICKRYYIKK